MDLGIIQTLPLKQLWPGEATHFTPWLAANISVLAAKLGMDLEVEKTEFAAGDFAADIVARDLSTNKRVIIENQYGGTDHRHLGQIITYASALGAGAVVWVSESIRPEHKAAIDFLNQNLKASLNFYGVEASAIRIDDSKPAFVLTVVSMPTEPVIDDESGPLSETRKKYKSYFQTLIDELRETHKFTNARAGQPQNWYTFASDNSRVYTYSASFAQGDKVRAEVYIDCGDKEANKALFDCLHQSHAQIDTAFGTPLSWERLENRRASRIAVYRDGNIDTDSETLAEIRVWMIANLLRFRDVFPARLKTCGELLKS